MIKQLANIITFSRILCSIWLLFCPVFSCGFYGVYVFCGLTDAIDGTIARKTNSSSKFGARLDTAADIVFVAVCLIKILPSIYLPVWLWIWIAIITTVKTGNLFYGLIRSKRLISIHTILNKSTGVLLFLFPFTFGFIEPAYSSVIVCSFATVSVINDMYYARIGRDLLIT